jgi:hypothetical protein
MEPFQKHSMVAIIQTSAAILTGSLAISSLRNIHQTALIQSQQKELAEGEPSLIYEKIVGKNKSDEVLRDLKNLSRRELFELYLLCSDPSEMQGSLDGEWCGTLLDNNGWIMVSMAIVLLSRV